MPANRSKYTVNVEGLDPTSLPAEDKNVFYSSANNRFELGEVSSSDGGGAANEVEVGPHTDQGGGSGFNPGDIQYGVFSRDNDSTNTTVSGSDGVHTIAIEVGGAIRSNEFRISTGSNSDIQSIGIIMPLRIQNEIAESPSDTNYPFDEYSPVANYYEHVQVIRPGNLSSPSQMSTFMTISLDEVSNYIGSGSYTVAGNGTGKPQVSSSYNYIKMEHVAYATNSNSDRRSQKCTHHFLWYRDQDNNHTALDLRATSVEDIRTPDGRVIIDPFRTTGSFDGSGNFVLSVYHFNVDYAQHVIKYTLM